MGKEEKIPIPAPKRLGFFRGEAGTQTDDLDRAKDVPGSGVVPKKKDLSRRTPKKVLSNQEKKGYTHAPTLALHERRDAPKGRSTARKTAIGRLGKKASPQDVEGNAPRWVEPTPAARRRRRRQSTNKVEQNFCETQGRRRARFHRWCSDDRKVLWLVLAHNREASLSYRKKKCNNRPTKKGKEPAFVNVTAAIRKASGSTCRCSYEIREGRQFWQRHIKKENEEEDPPAREYERKGGAKALFPAEETHHSRVVVEARGSSYMLLAEKRASIQAVKEEKCLDD